MVIPPLAREHLLVELHGGHPGVPRMKCLARSLMWWPDMDQAIEDMVRHCSDCQRVQASPPSAPLHPWKWPTCPWAQLHVDFAGPMDGRMYLIVVDAHSKWLEVLPMATATHCKNSLVEITHMSVPIMCCLLEHLLKQHLYLISSVIFTQRGQYNTPIHMTGCRFNTPVCCLWHIMCVVLATGCFNTGSMLLEGWGQHSPHAVLTQQA